MKNEGCLFGKKSKSFQLWLQLGRSEDYFNTVPEHANDKCNVLESSLNT